jgi:hypothetical protein
MLEVCQSVLTDGNPTTLQKKFKFVVRVSTEICHIAMKICMFYPHARMAKTLPTMLKGILYITDSAVISIRVRALNHYFFFVFAKKLVQNSLSLLFLLNGEMAFPCSNSYSCFPNGRINKFFFVTISLV